jgi:hypothetical protein
MKSFGSKVNRFGGERPVSRKYFFILTAVLLAGWNSCRTQNLSYPELWNFIQQNQWIDVHAHPAAGHIDYPVLSEKIMFGSDAGAPVFYWIAAQNSRDALYRALSKLVDKGRLTPGSAIKTAGKIMRMNALKVNGLKEK